MQKTPYSHTDIQWAWIGEYVTLEVDKALDMGYQVTEIYEVWHYDKYEQYNSKTKSGGLFTEYINTFLQMKQQADGFPSWVKTEEDKQEYIARYSEKEGIQLTINDIEKNPGIRSLSK